ncbi:MAG: hypothetical protein R2909_12240 [Gemmatimonadales bacterium]
MTRRPRDQDESGPSSAEPVFWGFTEDEWLRAHHGEPGFEQRLAALFTVLREEPAGGMLGNVSVEAMLALAKLSPDHARRVREQLDAGPGSWRARLEAGLPDARTSELILLLDRWADR